MAEERQKRPAHSDGRTLDGELPYNPLCRSPPLPLHSVGNKASRLEPENKVRGIMMPFCDARV